MQPLKITILGDYWDCQIYMGRLYLWSFDGSLKVYKWDDIVSSLIADPKDRLAMYCAFTKGNYFYNPELEIIFKDDDFKNLLQNKFNSLQRNVFEINAEDNQEYLYGEQDNPFDELPTDTEIINKTIYGVTPSGIWATDAHRYNRNKPVKTRPTHVWDCPILSLKANNYNQIALSAGSEGLYELNPFYEKKDYRSSLKKVDKSIYEVSKRHSLFSNYSYLSIYNSSNIANSFLALFNWEVHENPYGKEYERKFEKIIDESEIFLNSNRNKLSWGTQDKIYKAVEGGFEIVKFNNYAKEDEDERIFTKKRRIDLHAWKGEVISGSIAYFGTIIECENALVVALSDGTNITINGPITKWRVYPRSINYENHLHVILEDKIEIYSFNNDYFVDQSSKDLGIIYNKNKIIRNNKRRSFYS